MTKTPHNVEEAHAIGLKDHCMKLLPQLQQVVHTNNLHMYLRIQNCL